MNRMATVIGVAAIATLAGCKDPDYTYAHDSANQPKQISPAENDSPSAVPAADAVPAAVVEKPTCKCPPGTKHAKPCLCGAPNCGCKVVPPPPPPPPAPEYTVYVVKNGDYLAKISKRYNVTINSIKRLNNLKGDSIRIGQKLKLPGKFDIAAEADASGAAAAKTSISSSIVAYKGETKEYVVKNGDTLGAIAYGNGVTIRQLKALNGLKDNNLRVGQKIRIPANGKPVAKAAPAKKAVAAKAPAAPAQTAPVAEPVAPAVETTPVVAGPEPAAEAVPAAPAPAAEPQYTTYEVQDGEDMTAICIRFNASAAVIRELNNLPEGAQLTKGQIIKLPPEAQQ